MNSSPPAVVAAADAGGTPSALLPTATLRVKNGKGELKEVRLLCDTGAQVNLISEPAFKTMFFARDGHRTSIGGIGGRCSRTSGTIRLELWHRTKTERIDEATFAILDCVEWNAPQCEFLPFDLPDRIKADLADPLYNIRGGVDGIIGVSVLAKHLQAELHRGPHDTLMQETSFGWIIFGGEQPQAPIDALATANLVTASDVHRMVKRLWEDDELFDEQRPLTVEDVECEQLYESTIERGTDRYTVAIMMRPKCTLGDSKAAAKRRLYCLERRFEREPETRQKYIDFMREYEDLGHMKEASPLDPSQLHYYVPHHAVAIDRKFRVVFDGSAKTTNAHSINEWQYTGPRLQRDLTDILRTFRVGRYALTADIVKMFRQIAVRRQDWDLQRILWRESTRQPIKEYWLTVVTYGMVSSPYVAVKTLIRCANDNVATSPRAAEIAKRDFYVDDLLTSMHSQEDVIRVQTELNQLMDKGGFRLAKWRSNLPQAMPAPIDGKFVTDDGRTSVLGIVWDYATDEFAFHVQERVQPDVITRRILTSEAARIYDPQGYVTPIVIRARMFVQEAWKLHTDDGAADDAPQTSEDARKLKKKQRTQRKLAADWDQPLSAELQRDWRLFCNEVRDIGRVRLPRWVETHPDGVSQLHVFCDASIGAYGAAIYVRTKTYTGWRAHLLCSKARVAHVNDRSVPRLELQAVELGARFVKSVQQSPPFDAMPVFIWTDSEVVLHWLRKQPDELKTYVARRVGKIRRIVDATDCRHVRSELNPADLLSRGTRTTTLIDSALWWSGPDMLRDNANTWPPWRPEGVGATTLEIAGSEERQPAPQYKRVLLTMATADNDEIDLIEKYESYQKGCRLSAYVFRFISLITHKLRQKRALDLPWIALYDSKIWRTDAYINATHTLDDEWLAEWDGALQERGRKCDNYRIPCPSYAEKRNALNYWLLRAQEESFPAERKLVSNGKGVSRSSPLWMLSPQLFSDRLLRVKGRLDNANVAEDVKHPIILDRHSAITKALAIEAHRSLCHGGVQLCTQHLRQRYWIVGIRVLLRRVVASCMTCTRERHQGGVQFMADLPAVRVQPAPAFYSTGVDYAGPVALKFTRNTTHKGWIAVFICMRYKAVHLEAVTGLDTPSFLAALTRFINARAGCVRHIHSDNGTNFIGAERELREAAESWRSSEIADHLTTHGIEWHFTTPFAPHHGGIWESMVKMVKRSIRVMAGTRLFTYEQMSTLLSGVAASINSRPITPASSDPTDYIALSPSNFITMKPVALPLERDYTDVPNNRLTTWELITKLQQEFWLRWVKEYLTEQQRRNKWAGIHRSFQVGDMVLIRSDLTPATHWLLGRIVKVFLGKDELIRSCRVRTAKGYYENGGLRTSYAEYDRPITKLILLPVESKLDVAAVSGAGFLPQ